jgi:hypothetical protein
LFDKERKFNSCIALPMWNSWLIAYKENKN